MVGPGPDSARFRAHCISQRYKRQQETGLKMVPEGNDNYNDHDGSKTEEGDKQINDETDVDEESETDKTKDGDLSSDQNSNLESNDGGYASL